MQTPPQDRSDAFIASLLTSYPAFVQAVWDNPATRYSRYAPIGWPEKDMCEFIAHGPPQRGVLAPRGIGKTYLGTASYTCWRLFLDPDTKIIVVSKSQSAAKKMIKLVRGWIDSIDFLEHLRPRFDGSRTWRDNTDMFDAGPSQDTKDPSVMAIGIEGQLENARAHVIIADDVETKGNTRTLDARDDLAERVHEFTSVATYGDREIIYFGTYHHEESLYRKEAQRGVQFRSWPLLYPTRSEQSKIHELAPSVQARIDEMPSLVGTPVFDHRHPREYIEERRARGRTYFAMQQQLIADMGDELLYPLRLDDLVVFPVNRDKAPVNISWGMTNDQGRGTRLEQIPSLGFGTDSLHSPIYYDSQWEPYSSTRMWIDPSGRGADKTGYAIVAHLSGYLYVKDVGGLAGGYDPPTLMELAELARRHNVGHIDIEDNFGLGMFMALFEPVMQKCFLEPGKKEDYKDGWKCSVATVRTHQQKELRIIDALEPVTSQHRLVWDEGVARNEQLQYQYTRITKQRNCLPHDDELEAMAMCVGQWQLELNQDPETSADRHRQAWIEEQLEGHYLDSGRFAGVSQQAAEKRWFEHA